VPTAAWLAVEETGLAEFPPLNSFAITAPACTVALRLRSHLGKGHVEGQN
jgi:hypothetical protein